MFLFLMILKEVKEALVILVNNMFIQCKYPTVILNDTVYQNRRINLSNIVTFDKSNSYYVMKSTFDEQGRIIKPSKQVSVPSIKFTSIISNTEGKGEIFEWLFESETQRDDVLDNIDEQLNYRISR